MNYLSVNVHLSQFCLIPLEDKSDVSTHPDHVPSIFRFGRSPQKKVAHAKRSLERYERAERMIAKRICAGKENEKPSLHSDHGENTNEDGRVVHGPLEEQVNCDAYSSVQHTCEVETQTDMVVSTRADASTQTDLVITTPTYRDISTQVEDELKHKCTVQSTGVQTDKITESVLFSDPHIKDDDEKVLFYTGLPNYATLLLVLEFVTSGLPNSRGILSSFQELFLVLMKLRLNLEEKDLGYRFGIHQSTVSRIFKKWIALMAKQLSPLIRWPSTEEVRTTMPMAFRKFFSKCICIIDCTEVFIDRPSDLKVRAQTWSNYKQHNTVKFLIAVTPQGTISFVSKGWGGRASDKYITEHCGILEHLIHGDLVLADRGFTIQDSVGLYCAEVKVPPFTKGKKQLSRYEVDWSREISHVRIHVERVIGLLKLKYKILQGQLPINLITDKTTDNSPIDNIMQTCAALCNLSPSVVPFD